MDRELGKLYETTVKFPMTDIWMDSCGEEELDYAIERGAVGATSNPVIVRDVIKNEISIWKPKIKEMIENMPYASEDEIVWAIIDEVGKQRCLKLLPIFKMHHGKKGRLSIQTNAKFYRNTEKMIEQAEHFNSLGQNIMVKIPASEAGIKAIEECTYKGISTNATVSFTVSQAIAVAEAVEKGLNRREKEGLSIKEISPMCTLMVGRTDDWIKTSVQEENLTVDPDALEWGGIAVMKKAYHIYKERDYRTRLLAAAVRSHYHWSQLIGGDLSVTINYSWFRRLSKSDIEVISRIEEPVFERYMDVLEKIPEFQKSYDENSMEPEEFIKYGGFQKTLSSFLDGYDDLCKIIRNFMIYG